MLLCNKCGKENKDSSKFCTGCGSIIITAIQPAIRMGDTPLTETGNSGFLCTQCGKQNKGSAKFCVTCGYKLGSLIQSAPQHINTPIPEIHRNDSICTQCGKQNKAVAKFCVVCGNNLRLTIPESEKYQTNIPINGQSANVENEIQQKKLSGGSDTSIPGIITMGDQDSTISTVSVHENIPVEKGILLKVDQPMSRSVDIGKDNPVEQALPPKEETPDGLSILIHDDENKVKRESEREEEENQMQDSIPEMEANYPLYHKKKRKKIILWIISVLVLTSMGAFFLFGNRFGRGTGTSNNKQDIQSKEILGTNEGKVRETADIITSDLDTGKISAFMPADTLGIKRVATAPLTENADKPVTAETPLSPTQQMAIYDLDGRKICNDLVFSGNAEILSYSISKKTNLQCNVIISFRMPNSDINYRVTMIYKKKRSNYIYEDNICYFKAETGTDKSRVLGTHDVKGDLINYLDGKKAFCGIQYNSITDINITKVGDGEYYKDSGNTSYLVELSINNLNRKCQVNYTIDGKLYINPLR